MANLSQKHIACLALEGFEEAELTETVKALRDAGAVVDIVSKDRAPIRAFKHHDPSISVDVDTTFDDVKASDYDGVLLPGGGLNADAIRVEPLVQRFVQEIDRAGKPIAAICHAPWILVSAGLSLGRTLTSYHTIADDMRNGGAEWQDSEVVVDRNLVTSRQPGDIPAFNREFARLLEQAPIAALAR